MDFYHRVGNTFVSFPLLCSTQDPEFTYFTAYFHCTLTCSMAVTECQLTLRL